MHKAAQPLTPEDPALSPWWLRTVVIVLVLGFAGLAAMTTSAYRHAPPIPARTVDDQDALVFSGDDVRAGQAVFLKYGLMDNGSIWGHGAYLGPDYSAATLHRVGESCARAIAQEQYQRPLAALSPRRLAAVHAETAADSKPIASRRRTISCG